MKVAVMLGVDTIIVFSGCPGDCKESKNPNWVTCAWPSEYLEILDWQGMDPCEAIKMLKGTIYQKMA